MTLTWHSTIGEECECPRKWCHPQDRTTRDGHLCHAQSVHCTPRLRCISVTLDDPVDGESFLNVKSLRLSVSFSETLNLVLRLSVSFSTTLNLILCDSQSRSQSLHGIVFIYILWYWVWNVFKLVLRVLFNLFGKVYTVMNLMNRHSCLSLHQLPLYLFLWEHINHKLLCLQ